MVETYKCKGCGAPIEYDGSKGELVCEYCGTHMSVSEMAQSGEKYDSTVEDETVESEERIDVDGYKCQNCGAELITDDKTTATVCSFCKSPAIVKSRLTGQTMPAKIIPFSITSDRAKDIFRSWCGKGVFTPSRFKTNSFVEEMSGIYVPFWLYDYDANCSMEAHATRVRHHREGDYDVTHTDHFRVVRSGNAGFHLVPADASEKMPDDIMDLLEPYNYTDLKDFQMPYLSGFLSEKYSYDSREMAPRVENRVRSYMFRETRNTISGYTTVNVTSSNVLLRRRSAVYTLLPVWMITYRYNGQNKILAINGQTGKQVGTLPRSNKKMLGCFGGICAGVFAILMMLGGFFG